MRGTLPAGLYREAQAAGVWLGILTLRREPTPVSASPPGTHHRPRAASPRSEPGSRVSGCARPAGAATGGLEEEPLRARPSPKLLPPPPPPGPLPRTGLSLAGGSARSLRSFCCAAAAAAATHRGGPAGAIDGPEEGRQRHDECLQSRLPLPGAAPPSSFAASQGPGGGPDGGGRRVPKPPSWPGAAAFFLSQVSSPEDVMRQPGAIPGKSAASVSSRRSRQSVFPAARPPLSLLPPQFREPLRPLFLVRFEAKRWWGRSFDCRALAGEGTPSFSAGQKTPFSAAFGERPGGGVRA